MESCGGSYFKESEDQLSEKKIVISCDQDEEMWLRWTERGATLVDKEAILSGVLKQIFEPNNFMLAAWASISLPLR